MKGFQRRKLTNCWGNIFKIKKKHSSKYKYLVEVIKIGWKQIVLSMKGKTERKKNKNDFDLSVMQRLKDRTQSSKYGNKHKWTPLNFRNFLS